MEGQALKLAKTLAEQRRRQSPVSRRRESQSAELLFPGGVTAQLAMSRQGTYAAEPAASRRSPATIQEDLRGRDFTCNAIALSLNRASRGLLLDPMNGLADIEHRELRAISTYGFYDDPSRLLRLIRFRVRLGFAVEERTAMQVANAREAEVEKTIPPAALGEELKRIGMEDNPSEILEALEEAGLLALFSPALAGPERASRRPRQVREDRQPAARRQPLPAPPASGPFLYAFAEKLTPEERLALVKAHRHAQGRTWTSGRSSKRGPRSWNRRCASARIRKASQVYRIVSAAPPMKCCSCCTTPRSSRCRNVCAIISRNTC